MLKFLQTSFLTAESSENMPKAQEFHAWHTITFTKSNIYFWRLAQWELVSQPLSTSLTKNKPHCVNFLFGVDFGSKHSQKMLDTCPTIVDKFDKHYLCLFCCADKCR